MPHGEGEQSRIGILRDRQMGLLCALAERGVEVQRPVVDVDADPGGSERGEDSRAT